MENNLTKHHCEVLITGGDTRPGLAVARSLARRGVSTLVVGRSRDMALRSRLVKQAILAPPASRNDFIPFLRDLVIQHGVRMIVPMTDPDVLALEAQRDALGPDVVLAMASSASIRQTMNKRANLELATQCGVPCPRQFELEDPSQIPEMIEELGFPVILKNPGPTFDAALRPADFRVLLARDERQLREFVSRHHRDGVAKPLYQECATGTVHNVCCFAAGGKVLALHEYHSVRRHLGQGVLRRIVPASSELEAYARMILMAVRWDGPAHVGFFVSNDGKRTWYMETNGRFWGSVQGSVDAGWDFPYWTYRYFRSGEEPTPPPIRVGSQTCWHRGDLESLVQYLRGGDVPATGTQPGKLRAVAQYLSAIRPGIHSDVFRWSDPMPAVVDHWRLLQVSRDFLRTRQAD